MILICTVSSDLSVPIFKIYTVSPSPISLRYEGHPTSSAHDKVSENNDNKCTHLYFSILIAFYPRTSE